MRSDCQRGAPQTAVPSASGSRRGPSHRLKGAAGTACTHAPRILRPRAAHRGVPVDSSARGLTKGGAEGFVQKALIGDSPAPETHSGPDSHGYTARWEKVKATPATPIWFPPSP